MPARDFLQQEVRTAVSVNTDDKKKQLNNNQKKTMCMFVMAPHSGAELNANETKVFYTLMNTQCLKPVICSFKKKKSSLQSIS